MSTYLWQFGQIVSALFLCFALGRPAVAEGDPWTVFEGGEGPGKGKHIVMITGDEEYRSEEACPQLAKILSKEHGFKCTVLFSIDPKDGNINPNVNNNIPGLEALKTADLMLVFLRFRNLPDEQMQHIVDYLDSGKPVIGLRTATHAFKIPKDRKFARYSYDYGGKDFEKGFGRQVLGETWVNHYGDHGHQGTRGIIAPGEEKHPILRGIKNGDIFGKTDVYEVHIPLPGDSKVLVLGEITQTLEPDSKAAVTKKNDPMMPVAWVKTYTSDSGKTGRAFTTTMGTAEDFLAEGTRRMLVNACYWSVGLEDKIPAKSNVDVVGEFKPHSFKEGYAKGKKPADYAK